MRNRIKFFLELYYPIRKTWKNLSLKRRLQFKVMFVLFILQAFAELISLASVVPFISAISNPVFIYERIEGYDFIKNIFNISAPNDVIIPFSLIFILLIFLTGFFRLVTLYFSLTISYLSGSELSVTAFKKTLFQKYLFFLKNDSNEIITTVTNKIDGAMGAVSSIMMALNAIIIIIFILLTFVIIYPLYTISITLFLSSCYISIVLLSKKYLRKQSQIIARGVTVVLKSVREALANIRNLIIEKKHSHYLNIYNKEKLNIGIAAKNSIFLGMSPKILMETIGIVFLSLLALYIALNSSNMDATLPLLAIIALAAQKLLPLFQQFYFAYTSIESSYQSLIDVSDILDLETEKNLIDVKLDKFSTNKSIEFKDVYFSYNQGKPVLKNLNFKINFNNKIGLVGDTGSGKSTFMDLLMGLIKPDSGKILIDGVELDDSNINSWQNKISHVPQNIYISNLTVYENIAFGCDKKDIDLEKVHQCAKKAHINVLIESMDKQYETFLGERGIKISGGEKQRIALARAFYRDFDIMTLDEATSSLDNVTEEKIINEIEQLDKNKTIFIIAHRITTIKNCDIILEFKDGRIINSGTYYELVEKSKTFKELTKNLK